MQRLSQIGTAISALTIVFLTQVPPPISAMGCPLQGAFEEGDIHGVWVGVLLDFDGKPGSPHMATVYTTTMTPGGHALTNLGTVHAHGDGAAEFRAIFVNDKLYIVNDRYAPGPNDGRYEYYAIQRFGVQFGKLIPDGEGILSLSRLPTKPPGISDCDPFPFDKSLQEVIEQGQLDQMWIPVTKL
jgi:hypothetical protein